MKKINAISILRIIATFMVVMVHFGRPLPLPQPLPQFIFFGREGVTFFYIISGYLIAKSLEKNNDTLTFYKKRALRIVPVYFAVVIVNIIAAVIIGTYPADITHLGWLRYILFIQAIVPTNDYTYWNNAAALWAMTAFAVFYLIAPVIHCFVHKDGKVSNAKNLGTLIFFVLMCLVSARLYLCLGGEFEDSGIYLADHSPFAVLFKFYIGMFIYYGCRDKNRTIWIALVGVTGAIFGINKLIIPALFGIIFYCIIDKEITCGEKLGKALAKLDEYSFSVYLGHTTVMFIMSRIQETVGFSDVKLAIFDLIGCVIFIPILHELVEKPCAKVGKKLMKL